MSDEILEEFNEECVVLVVFLRRSSIKSSSFDQMKGAKCYEIFASEHERLLVIA
ncbi:MAG: hypothetical protein ACTS73_04720 [Arsenophonus sp. NEOnobi-MAG3]